jgi:glycosyltransferase involved in cell wall biosynthesis
MANALVMFSNYENMPCVILEALCSGLPIVSSNVGGIAEIINTSNGYLIPAKNEEELYDAMIKMVKNYHQFNPVKISEEASKLSCYKTVGREIADVYDKIVTSFN